MKGFYIAKPAQVSFSGGYFGDGLSGYGDNVNPIAFFLAEASRMKPKDLLAPGYSFYTHHANFQPDLLLEGDDIPTYLVISHLVQVQMYILVQLNQAIRPQM